FNTPAWETHDYRYRLSGTNIHYAQLEDNGEMIAVAAHKDPGVPNWFDTSGLTQGMIHLRWMETDDLPMPTCELVKHADLFNHLPENVKTMIPEERVKQLRERRLGIYKRFIYM